MIYPDFIWFILILPDFIWFYLIYPDFIPLILILSDLCWSHLKCPLSTFPPSVHLVHSLSSMHQLWVSPFSRQSHSAVLLDTQCQIDLLMFSHSLPATSLAMLVWHVAWGLETSCVGLLSCQYPVEPFPSLQFYVQDLYMMLPFCNSYPLCDKQYQCFDGGPWYSLQWNCARTLCLLRSCSPPVCFPISPCAFTLMTGAHRTTNVLPDSLMISFSVLFLFSHLTAVSSITRFSSRRAREWVEGHGQVNLSSVIRHQA